MSPAKNIPIGHDSEVNVFLLLPGYELNISRGEIEAGGDQALLEWPMMESYK